jgi:uncharacterized heparinase superfamily protein
MVIESSKYPEVLGIQIEKNYIDREGITIDYKNFTFLSETRDLSEIGWDNPAISKLWRYNLHYFEFLLQNLESDNHLNQQVELVEDWIRSNPFGKGTAWEPYPTSLRIVNWIKWHSGTGALSEKAKISLWNQVKWLAARPEYHLLGNHLFINSKALLFSSTFFQIGEDSKIYRKAISILKKELDEQFLGDGAHFELSPMYHSLAMEDLLDLLSISSKLPLSFPKSQIEKKINLGMKWLKTMIYNNEELSHFNDCANGIAPTFHKLKEYENRLNIKTENLEKEGLVHHRESGYMVYKDSKFHLIADVGNIGPDYLPGHAHADTLSFELAVNDQRIIVNSGTSVYGVSRERLRQRGTSAHSTVQIDGENSSEVWSGFRVARRARPFRIKFDSSELSNNPISFSASHDGYKRLKNGPIHNRSWSFKVDKWIIEDKISGNGNHFISRYYFHPDIKIEKKNRVLTISNNYGSLAKLEISNAGEIEISDTTYHDEFGKIRSNKCIELNAVSPCRFGITIELL